MSDVVVLDRFKDTGLGEFEVLFVSAVYAEYVYLLGNREWFVKTQQLFSDEFVYDLFIASTFYELWLESADGDFYVYEIDVLEWANNVIVEIENTIDVIRLVEECGQG